MKNYGGANLKTVNAKQEATSSQLNVLFLIVPFILCIINLLF